MNEYDSQPQTPEPTADRISSFERRYHSSVEGVVTLLDWLLVAFILALVFQAFGIQAFQIPTGSMAETLRGDHYRMRCLRCGYPFDTGSDSLSMDLPQCPNCAYLQPAPSVGPMVNGDRIFVLKCIYQFFDPQRWDVVVFKNPTNPKDNYIKRLIALPGERLQIIDGDIYINGKIVRKPPNVQREQWMPIYLQRFQPPLTAAAADQDQEGPRTVWKQPFSNAPGSSWRFDPDRPGRFLLNSDDASEHTLLFDTGRQDDFRSIYGYNDSGSFSVMPMCSDLMIRFQAKGRDDKSAIAAVLEKYGVRYAARVEMSGAVCFLKYEDGKWVELNRILLDGIKPGVFETFEFANVDRRLVLRWADKRLSYDLVGDKDLAGIRQQKRAPYVSLFAVGGADLRDVGLYRDIYYMDTGIRATEANPFELQADEFFVCGDNSPNSLDSRLWSSEGLGNHGVRYRKGIVPRDFMMGKAVLVYWSQAFRPRPTMMPVIPNFDNIKVIYGSSDQDY